LVGVGEYSDRVGDGAKSDVVAGGVEVGEVEIVEVDVLVGAGLEARGGAVVGVAVAMRDVVAAFV
jgi:hypothetical protein